MQAYLNVLRRWLVRKLLGDGLALKVRETPSGYELQLVDLKRRIPYGAWRAKKHNWRPHMFSLTWVSASEQKSSTAESQSRSAQSGC